jgi:hypothetical protein
MAQKKRKRLKLCRVWPKCSCIVQGYVNGQEGERGNYCGRKLGKPEARSR